MGSILMVAIQIFVNGGLQVDANSNLGTYQMDIYLLYAIYVNKKNNLFNN